MTKMFGGSLCGLAAAGRRRVPRRCELPSRAAQLRGSRASEKCRVPFAGDARGQAFGVFGWDARGMGAGSPFVHGMVKPIGATVSLGGQIVDAERGRVSGGRALLPSTERSVL